MAGSSTDVPALTNAGSQPTSGGAALVNVPGAEARSFPQGQDEPQAERARQEEGARMGELAEYGLEENKDTATTKVHALRRDAEGYDPDDEKNSGSHHQCA